MYFYRGVRCGGYRDQRFDLKRFIRKFEGTEMNLIGVRSNGAEQIVPQ